METGRKPKLQLLRLQAVMFVHHKHTALFSVPNHFIVSANLFLFQSVALLKSLRCKNSFKFSYKHSIFTYNSSARVRAFQCLVRFRLRLQYVKQEKLTDWENLAGLAYKYQLVSMGTG